MPGLVPGIHVFLWGRESKAWMAGTSPAMTATNAFPRFRTSPAKASRPACFPALLAPNKGREIGGGRATRQPGQVRKEAALTRSGSGRSSVSYLFFERIAQKRRTVLRSIPLQRVFRKSRYRILRSKCAQVECRKPASRDNQLRIHR